MEMVGRYAEANAALEKIIASKALLSDGQFNAALEAENERWMQAQAAVEWYGISVKSVSDAIGRSMAEALVEGTSLASGTSRDALETMKLVYRVYWADCTAVRQQQWCFHAGQRILTLHRMNTHRQ